MDNRIEDAKTFLANCTDEEYKQFVLDFAKTPETDGVYLYELLKFMQELGRG